MRGISTSEAYHCPEPILIIVGTDGGTETLSISVFPRGEREAILFI